MITINSIDHSSKEIEELLKLLKEIYPQLWVSSFMIDYANNKHFKLKISLFPLPSLEIEYLKKSIIDSYEPSKKVKYFKIKYILLIKILEGILEGSQCLPEELGVQNYKFNKNLKRIVPIVLKENYSKENCKVVNSIVKEFNSKQ